MRNQSGRALVEILVASMILSVGISAVFGSFISSGRAGATAERHELAVTRAEEELEAIRGLGYERIGLTSAPPTSSDPDNPGRRVEGSNFRVLPELAEPLVMPADLGAGVAAVVHQSVAQLGNVRMRIYRFVTWRDEECPGIGPDVAGTLHEIDRLRDSVHDLLTAQAGAKGAISELQKSIVDIDALGLTSLAATLDPLEAPLARIGTRLDKLVGPVQRLAANAGGLAKKVSDLGANLDICDLDPNSIGDLGRLDKMRVTLAGLENVLKELEPAVADVEATLNTVTSATSATRATKAAAALLVLPGQVAKANQEIADVEAYLELMRGTYADADLLVSAWADDLAHLVNSLSLAPNSLRDSKRVIVAVAIEDAGSLGPNKPVWASTVVTDPDAGLLG